MAEAGTGFLEQLKSCIVWSWTYLWTVWFFIVLFLVYILRVPLKINDNLSTGKAGAAGPAALTPPPPRKVSATRAGPRLAGAGSRARAQGRAGARAPDVRGHPPSTRRLRWPGRATGSPGPCGGGRRPSPPRGPATPRRWSRAAHTPRGGPGRRRRHRGPMGPPCWGPVRGRRRRTGVANEGVPADAPSGVGARTPRFSSELDRALPHTLWAEGAEPPKCSRTRRLSPAGGTRPAEGASVGGLPRGARR